MKRADQHIAGRPKSDCTRCDVAGMPATPRWVEVASFQHALGRDLRQDSHHDSHHGQVRGLVDRTLDDPMAVFAEEAMLLEDLADFLDEGGEESADSNMSVSVHQANPDFRERLRGRLWRTYVQTHLRDGGGQH